MLLAQVESFLEIAQQGNLSRAAEGLHLTQPALTARLHALEVTLGAALFHRGRRGMVLTDAGRAFLPYAERAVESLRGGAALVMEIEHGAAGELAIGTAPAVGAYVLPGALFSFAEQHPNVRLLVRTGHSEEIIEMLLRGEVQLGLTRRLQDRRVTMRPLYQDELVLVASPDHPLAGLDRVPVERLNEARLIMFDRTSSYFDLTNALFRSAGVAPQGVMELDNVDAAKKMVEHNLGVALLPATAVAREVREGVLRRVPLAGAQPIRRQMMVVERRGDPQPRHAQIFLEVLDRVAASVADEAGGLGTTEREDPPNQSWDNRMSPYL